jgi:hypothetical protein
MHQTRKSAGAFGLQSDCRDYKENRNITILCHCDDETPEAIATNFGFLERLSVVPNLILIGPEVFQPVTWATEH